MTTCNSPYLYAIIVIGQVTWVAKVVIHYIYGVTQFNSLQLHYNYNHNIVLMLLIFIHMALWRFLDFFFEVLISIVYYDY
jgi:hypothetical protein